MLQNGGVGRPQLGRSADLGDTCHRAQLRGPGSVCGLSAFVGGQRLSPRMGRCRLVPADTCVLGTGGGFTVSPKSNSVTPFLS